jgi:hypothetical protein
MKMKLVVGSNLTAISALLSLYRLPSSRAEFLISRLRGDLSCQNSPIKPTRR